MGIFKWKNFRTEWTMNNKDQGRKQQRVWSKSTTTYKITSAWAPSLPQSAQVPLLTLKARATMTCGEWRSSTYKPHSAFSQAMQTKWSTTWERPNSECKHTLKNVGRTPWLSLFIQPASKEDVWRATRKTQERTTSRAAQSATFDVVGHVTLTWPIIP